jgi:hypothetical protein
MRMTGSNDWGYSFFIEQKCRIYAAFGVSQTPKSNYLKED